MKYDTMNPWVIIRWAAVVVVYAVTVAIAIDQIKDRDRKISEFRGKLEAVKSGIGDIGKSSAELSADSAKQLEGLKTLSEGLKTQSLIDQLIKRMDSTVRLKQQFDKKSEELKAMQGAGPLPGEGLKGWSDRLTAGLAELAKIADEMKADAAARRTD